LKSLEADRKGCRETGREAAVKGGGGVLVAEELKGEEGV